MKASFFKLEQDDELVDVMSIRLVGQNEIEVFFLTQAIGLLEAVERKIALTSQCKESVLRYTILEELETMGSEIEFLETVNLGVKLQGGISSVSDEVAQEASEIKEMFLDLLKERLKEGRKKREEWEELYRLNLKTLKQRHEETRQHILEMTRIE